MRKRIKKAFIAVLALLLAITVAGCNGSVSPSTKNNTTPSTLPPIVKGFKNRFVFISDPHISEKITNYIALEKTMEQIKLLDPQPDLIIIGGDIVESASKTERYESRTELSKEFFLKYYPMEMILPMFGNNELKSNRNDLTNERIFGKMYSEFSPTSVLNGYNKTVYYYDYGDVRLIILNSFHRGEENRITGAQLEWFKDAVSDDTKIKFVFSHSPAYPTGTQEENSLDEYPEDRDAFWTILDNENVSAFFSGHEHSYSRKIIDSSFNPDYKRAVNQIVSGTSSQLANNAKHSDTRGTVVPPKLINCFTVIDVGETQTQIRAVNINNNNILDVVTIPNIK